MQHSSSCIKGTLTWGDFLSNQLLARKTILSTWNNICYSVKSWSSIPELGVISMVMAEIRVKFGIAVWNMLFLLSQQDGTL